MLFVFPFFTSGMMEFLSVIFNQALGAMKTYSDGEIGSKPETAGRSGLFHQYDAIMRVWVLWWKGLRLEIKIGLALQQKEVTPTVFCEMQISKKSTTKKSVYI